MTTPILKGLSSADDNVTYSVIIPAFNEEVLLPATLDSLKLAMESIPCKGEIIVVDNNSTDNTRLVAKEHGARVLFEPFRQIAKARNRGARDAKGYFYIFLDADTILPSPLLETAIKHLQNGKHCGGGTLLSFDSQLPVLAGILVRFWNWLSKTGKLAAGSFIFCLSRGFHEIGGFDENVYAGEEIILSRKLKSWGKRQGLLFTIINDHPVITSGRKFHWHSTIQLALLLILFTIFPFAPRYRSLCSFWYGRPRQ